MQPQENPNDPTEGKTSGRIRIFLALIPDEGSRDRLFRKTRSTVPSQSDRWTHPDDLHMTLLFGGAEPKICHPAWKKAVETAADSLSTETVSHVERTGRITWDSKRKFLALEFPPEAPFWREADRVYHLLSERLMGTAPVRTLWPHLTLARHVLIKRESVFEIGTIANQILVETPLRWTRVRLLESPLGNLNQSPRYRTLFERLLDS